VPDAVLEREVRLTSVPRFVVSGMVVDATDGTPVANAEVRLGGSTFAPVLTTQAGEFSFAGVPSGRYRVTADGGICWRPRSRRVVVGHDEAVTVRLRPKRDAFGHRCQEEWQEWIEGEDDVALEVPPQPVSLPFPFYFYGQPRTAIYPSPYGFLVFTDDADFFATNGAIPSISAPNDAIYPFWADLYWGNGAWKTATIGERPNRIFALEYENFLTYLDGSRVDFEVLFYERDSSLVFQYRNEEAWADGRSATIGIESPDGTDALGLSLDEPAIRDGLTLRIVPPRPDRDGDGIVDTVDLCPEVADPEQRDRDGDGYGNACDAFDGTLLPTAIRVRRSTSAAHPNGRVVLEGEFLRQGSGDSTDVPDGMTVRLTDSLQLDQTVEWLGEECRMRTHGIVRCRRAKAPHHSAQLRPLPSDIPGVQAFLVGIRLVQLDLAAPFVAPLSVSMTNDPRQPTRGIDRVGSTDNCKMSGSGLDCWAR
jgi:hypothetical protein